MSTASVAVNEPAGVAAVGATTCSRGWGARCAAARSARCRCRCGGDNHGNPAARPQQKELALLTPHEVFDPEWTPHGVRDDKHFVRPPRDVVIWREGGSVHADVPHLYTVHSPAGWEYGYAGSGPADLALNILGEFLPAPMAWTLHQSFKFAFIATLSQQVNRHVLNGETIRAWIRQQWERSDT